MWGKYTKESGKSASWLLITFILIWSNVLLNFIVSVPASTFAAGFSPVALSVYGQGGSFTTNTANNGGVSASSLSGPRRVAIDSSGGMYVADTGNNRVLYFPSGSTTATRVYGQGGSFTTNTANKGGVSANSFNQPGAVALDSSGNLYVADTGNNRVLYFASGSTTATRVYGQNGSFTTNTGNQGGVTANTLNAPAGITLDSSGKLYVADTGNNRVLVFNAGSTTATVVYGQGGNFQSNNVNHGSLDANGLNQPAGLALDSSNDLYVADTSNNRVLYFVSGSTTATRVYGQGGSFGTNTANNGGVSANSLNLPADVALDSSGNLYVADTSNNRVLFFTTGSTTATTVYGQGGSFTTDGVNNGGVSASSLNAPMGVTISNIASSGSTAYIADTGNNRVLFFKRALLFIPIITPSFLFTLNGTTGNVTSQQTFRVSDTTQSGVGWHMTITSTQFTTTSGKTLPTTALTITNVSAVCTSGQTCVLPINTVTSYPITVPAGTTAPTAVTFLGAQAGTGTGDVTVTVTFSLRVPQGTAAGTYTSTVTEALVKGQ